MGNCSNSNKCHICLDTIWFPKLLLVSLVFFTVFVLSAIDSWH
uniref:Uncharacterized protein n=1 Tax=Arundo donax TaxID=35708 RepID=A0A0A8ZXB5_ARUDO